jgi:hypothetical protein
MDSGSVLDIVSKRSLEFGIRFATGAAIVVRWQTVGGNRDDHPVGRQLPLELFDPPLDFQRGCTKRFASCQRLSGCSDFPL